MRTGFTGGASITVTRLPEENYPEEFLLQIYFAANTPLAFLPPGLFRGLVCRIQEGNPTVPSHDARSLEQEHTARYEEATSRRRSFEPISGSKGESGSGG